MSNASAPGWDAVSVAVALLTAENAGTGDQAAEILAGADRDEVMAVLVIMAGAFLRSSRVAPDSPPIGPERAAAVIRHLGLWALEEASR